MTLLRDPENLETQLLLSHVDFAGKRVLEIGCGEGRLTGRLATHSGPYFGIDLNPERLCEARTVAAVHPNVSLALTDAAALPFPRERFDRAVLAWSL